MSIEAGQGRGSGFFAAPRTIITNRHVIQDNVSVTVRLSKDGRIVNGQGADTDIVVASAKAYINALNKLDAKAERLNPQL